MKTVRISVNGNPYVVEVGDLSTSPLSVVVNGKTYAVELEKEATTPKATAAGEPAASKPTVPTVRPNGGNVPVAAVASARIAAGSGTVIAPMPGKILSVSCTLGCTVSFGDGLVVLEAMKMENLIRAQVAGVVKEIRVAPGQSVSYGDVLVVVE